MELYVACMLPSNEACIIIVPILINSGNVIEARTRSLFLFSKASTKKNGRSLSKLLLFGIWLFPFLFLAECRKRGSLRSTKGFEFQQTCCDFHEMRSPFTQTGLNLVHLFHQEGHDDDDLVYQVAYMTLYVYYILSICPHTSSLIEIFCLEASTLSLILGHCCHIPRPAKADGHWVDAGKWTIHPYHPAPCGIIVARFCFQSLLVVLSDVLHLSPRKVHKFPKMQENEVIKSLTFVRLM